MRVLEMAFEVICTGEFGIAAWYPTSMDRVLVLFMNGFLMPFLVSLALEALPAASVQRHPPFSSSSSLLVVENKSASKE